MSTAANKVVDVRDARRKRMLSNYAKVLHPSHWATVDEIESLCSVFPTGGMLTPDMSLLDWQSGEDSAGMSPEKAVSFYPPTVKLRRGDRWRQTETGEWTTDAVPRRARKRSAWDSITTELSRWPARARIHAAVRALSRARPQHAPRPPVARPPVAAQTPRVVVQAAPEAAFVPLGRRHVFLDGDGCWRCMNGDIVESIGKGDYAKLLGMTTSQWFALVEGMVKA